MHDVSFKVHQGEIFAIAGVSGNGQVEIADAIAGLIPVHSGTIRLNGRDITNLDVGSEPKPDILYSRRPPASWNGSGYDPGGKYGN